MRLLVKVSSVAAQERSAHVSFRLKCEGFLFVCSLVLVILYRHDPGPTVQAKEGKRSRSGECNGLKALGRTVGHWGWECCGLALRLVLKHCPGHISGLTLGLSLCSFDDSVTPGL